MAGWLTRAKAALGRWLGRAPSDWAGPDLAAAWTRSATPFAPDNRHDIVCLGSSASGPDPRLLELARAGHRLFRIGRGGGAPSGEYEIHELAAGVFDVAPGSSGGDALFRSLDSLRRDLGFGATALLFEGDAHSALAERLHRERAWAVRRLDGPALRDLSATALAAELARAFPRVSIAIVTFHNRELNRLCLESVFARTEWPHFEVLVVDNGSTDGTPQLLGELARRDARLEVIALAENRGFPAACNLALERARGEFLVLLNNDTVVTRGWLSALARHLTADPRLGLVGPVTNAIANEARVETGYRDLRHLPDWAAAWVRAHDGETFDIPMLAFFCVAIRRAAWQAVGPLDTRFGLGLFEDGDYNRRAREAGWRVLCARDAFVHHWQNASFRKLGRDKYFALYEENRRRFEEKWKSSVPRGGGPGGGEGDGR